MGITGLYHACRYKETKGIVVNTFQALEEYAINSVSASGLPPVYPVGPVLDLAGPIQWHPNRDQHHRILKWLDDQPKSSVRWLERTGFRFLWSIKSAYRLLYLPGEYADAKEVTILAHQAIGGFVSHRGWKSILESLWHGVPIATWPLYAEQMNASQLEGERGIKCLMESDSEVRKRVKEMSQKSRMAATENGSSHASLTSLIDKLAAGI
ncbi:UDP-glucosyltransferase, putative [Ricinus communis]|uniref:UDP-glucosyltransferase, putative n=1 Tax=Ricinus communis TaxID=3988 RepID=B9SQ83_RICCO|nr:UDP-glucosyltransferase, putative [Ricinus communis]